MRYRIEASRQGEALDREVYLGEYRGSYQTESEARAALAELEESRPQDHESVTYRVLDLRDEQVRAITKTADLAR